MKKKSYRILVTGGSSGIGFDVAKTLAQAGHKVYAGARRTELMEPLREFGVTPLRLDVCDEAAIDECLAAAGEIDILINNAGFGYFGAIENVPMEEARRQLDVNVFGLASLCRKVLPGMRERGFGRIINVSSVAGRACMYFGAWYNVSKYAVEALSEAMRMEVKPFGIDVVLIEPGGIKTNWGIIAARHLAESSAGTAYEGDALREAAVLDKGYSSNFLSSPSKVTHAIVRAVKARRPRARYLTGSFARTMVVGHAILPARWWDSAARILASPKLVRFAEKLNSK
ncbi:MAG: SDR family NAD(P)-dependent oxidoreductase [Bacteroidales bacterium]|nr:SDR family NAD(P)-dependent oxidoreductase [Bacteroidales bacterium]